MMDEYFFSSQEEQVIDNLRSIYYADAFDIGQVRSQLGALDQQRRELVHRTAFEEVSAEQAQRRRYIAATIYPNGGVSDSASEILATGLYDASTKGSYDQLGRAIGVSIDQNVVTEEALNQSKIYTQVDKNLRAMGTHLLYEQKVKPVYPLLDSLPTDTLQELSKAISSFIENASLAQKQRATYNPELPPSVTTPLSQAKLSLSPINLQTLSDKVSFLMTILPITEGIIQARVAGPDTSQNTAVPRVIATMLYLANTKFSYD